MFAERVAHGRHQLIGKACRLARAKVGIECRRIELGGDGLLSFGRVNPAAAFRRARQGCRMRWRPITLSCMVSHHLGRPHKACRACGVEPGQSPPTSRQDRCARDVVRARTRARNRGGSCRGHGSKAVALRPDWKGPRVIGGAGNGFVEDHGFDVTPATPSCSTSRLRLPPASKRRDDIEPNGLPGLAQHEQGIG